MKVAINSANLSGGQRQRLAIARGIISRPEFLIFDDSFSALDLITDKKINQNLNTHLKDSTMIIISQRISTIQNSDKIIVIEKGKIVGCGKHKDLLANNRVYREIAASQRIFTNETA
jgi:ATP-binding cassette subfamily B protein